MRRKRRARLDRADARRLTGSGSPVLLAGYILGVALPVPESAEVRFATATADGRFTLP